MDQPLEWLRATKALAHFDSVVPGFGIIPAGHPTAYIEFPGRSQLDAAPNRDVGHTVEALADGSAFIDEDHNGAGSTGERFAAPTGMNERLSVAAVPLAGLPTTPNRPSSPTACAAPTA